MAYLASDVAHQHVASIGSTNAELLTRAGQGEQGPFWLTAGVQTSGRGRADRQWVSPAGNLYASLLLTDPCEPRFAPGLGFVAGVAVIRAVRAACPALRGVALKWPNDVLVGGAKVAGILPEARHNGPSMAVVIGMGINCAFYPDQTPYPATSLAQAGAPIAPHMLFDALRITMADALATFDHGNGYRHILDQWRQDAFGIGTSITVRPPSGEISGIFENIDADGALLLRQGSALTRISAGDVYFPPA